jgi:lipoyl(octanoyl) transferase
MELNPVLNVMTSGQVEFKTALRSQLELVDRRQNGLIPDTLWFLEHPAVITMGRRADDTHLPAGRDFLSAKGIAIHNVDRGGEATYHGPGQIVGYTVIDLNARKGHVRRFVFDIEEVFIRLLRRDFHIRAHRDLKHRGVWVRDKKIVSLGISVKKGVTMHGFAFNVNNDLEPFTWIIPCGIQDSGVTSLKEITRREQDLPGLQKRITGYFLEVFGYKEKAYLSKNNASGSEDV